ncbi:MAG: glutathione peroxidase [Polaromonas sp.]|nr:glutathione peroxidase [Polaromonas sp.]
MLPNHEGQRVPDTTFRTRDHDQWKPVSSKDIFNGRTVVLFALPGAYTPTCSTSHLPRFNELAPLFRANGVDEVVCLAVNDAFVMDEWAKSQEAGNLRLLPDGNGQFTEAMGMLVDKSDLGFGKRSWRYAMLVRDGVIEKMFIEPEKDGDPFEVSDADTMLAYVAPDVRPPETFTLFTKPGCSYCTRAKALLEEKNLPYEEIVLGKGITPRSLEAVAGARTTPQVFVGGRKVGGLDELQAWLADPAH